MNVARKRQLQQAFFPFALAQEPREPRPGTREWAEQLLAEALAGPDPADERLPQVGDTIEVLWTHAPNHPWEPGVADWIGCHGIMSVRMTGLGRHVFWDAAVTRADARRIFTTVCTVWRWPRREEEIA